MNRSIVRVLVVDDDLDEFIQIDEALGEIESAAFKTIWARSSEDTSAIIRDQGFDVCLMSCRADTGNGVIEELRRCRQNCPVIMISDEQAPNIEATRINADAISFLAKEDITPLALERTINSALATNEHQRRTMAHEHAERLNQVQTAFLGMVSHELRTPLNAIIGYAEFMLKEPFGDLGNQNYTTFLRDIRTSSLRLQSTVDSILDFSQLIAGAEQVNEEELDPSAEAHYVAHLMGEMADAADVSIKVRNARPEWRVLADRSALRKILANLIHNGLKFSPRGGEISVTFDCGEDGAGWFEVTDNGIGMSGVVINRAAEPFRQGDEGLQRSYEGIGLGLPIVRSIAELHGGTLDIHSEMDEGTTVRVTFPKARLFKVALEAVG